MTKLASPDEFSEYLAKFLAERVYLPLRERIEYLEAEVKQLKRKLEEQAAKSKGARK